MKGASMPSCSVVVCTHNRPEALDACLAAVFAGTRSASEVVVVDSAPSDDGARHVAARRGARYLRVELPGVSRARNRAAKESGSDILAYLDGDTVPEAGWLDPLLAEFADPDVAAVAGRVLPPAADMVNLPMYAWFGIADHGEERRVFDRTVPRWFELCNFESVLLGANMALRRSVFESWKGFDERLGAGTSIYGQEEPRAFFDLLARGLRVVYAPGSVVRHAFSDSREQLKGRAIHAIEATAAYMALLLVEEPAYRKETWGYIRRKLGQVRPLFTREHGGGEPLVPGYRVVAARLRGLWLYMALRLKGGRAS